MYGNCRFKAATRTPSSNAASSYGFLGLRRGGCGGAGALAAGFSTQADNIRVVGGVLRDHVPFDRASGSRADESDSGAVTLMQRCVLAANLIFDLHCLVLDGAQQRGANGAPGFPPRCPAVSVGPAKPRTQPTLLPRVPPTCTGPLPRGQHQGPSRMCDRPVRGGGFEAARVGSGSAAPVFNESRHFAAAFVKRGGSQSCGLKVEDGCQRGLIDGR